MQKTRPLRFASWAAVSSLPQAKKVSNAEQLAENRACIDRHGGELVAELVVPGESRNIVLFEDACRAIPAYAQLYQLIKDRAFDVLVYLDRSRLGRKAPLSMAVVELCYAAGIGTCETESGGLIQYGSTYDQMLIGAIKSVGAQQEIHKLTERHRIGMAARVRSGKPPGFIVYGYKAIWLPDGSRQIVIDEKPASVVKLVYDLYTTGYGLRQIANLLNESGTPSPAGRTAWGVSSVRALLRVPWRYAGFVEINRHTATGREYIKAASKDVPPIISMQVAQMVEDLNESRRGTRRAPVPHRFTGVLWCETCGGKMWHYSYRKRDGSTGYKCTSGLHLRNTISEFELLKVLKAAIVEIGKHLDESSIKSAAAQARVELQQEIDRVMLAIDSAYARLERIDSALALGSMSLERHASQAASTQKIIDTMSERLAVLQTQQARTDYAEGRESRKADLVAAGVEMLEGDPFTVNLFLRERIKMWCADYHVVRVEFI